ncbi:MAG: hypothetical protein FWD71_01675 [Oscillospiraceae bacterium]|nr:hypothetical protein [Oscillospiraceae bacterium]
MKIKKFISLLLICFMSCALILTSFAGCSNTSDNNADTTVVGNSTVAGSVADTTTSAPAVTTTAAPATTTAAPETTTGIPPANPPANIPAAAKSFLTAAATGDRNNYNGPVGYEFQCNADMTVTFVGRPLNGEMLDSHVIYIWDVSAQSLLATVAVMPDSPLDALGFKIAPLSAPLVLKKDQQYIIVSSEQTDGDKWYDVGVAETDAPELSPTPDCTIITPAFGNEDDYDSYPANVYNPGGQNKGYTGVTFYYTLN